MKISSWNWIQIQICFTFRNKVRCAGQSSFYQCPLDRSRCAPSLEWTPAQDWPLSAGLPLAAVVAGGLCRRKKTTSDFPVWRPAGLRRLGLCPTMSTTGRVVAAIGTWWLACLPPVWSPCRWTRTDCASCAGPVAFCAWLWLGSNSGWGRWWGWWQPGRWKCRWWPTVQPWIIRLSKEQDRPTRRRWKLRRNWTKNPGPAPDTWRTRPRWQKARRP